MRRVEHHHRTGIYPPVLGDHGDSDGLRDVHSCVSLWLGTLCNIPATTANRWCTVYLPDASCKSGKERTTRFGALTKGPES